MATAPSSTTRGSEAPTPPKSTARRKTAHLKLVPSERELRDTIRRRAQEIAARLDRSVPAGKDVMEGVARQLLEELGQPEGYVGWTMVMLASAFWQHQVAQVPYSRRLFLLPHCLKHAEGCPAEYNEFGLDCERCGACRIADFRTKAEELGYKVLVAEGSPIVLKIIVSGHVDAIVGVACLNVLEKAIDKILLAGIPCMAVPLHSGDCRNTTVDEDWVWDMIQVPHSPGGTVTKTYVHLLRAASGMFVADELERLVPRERGGPRWSELRARELSALEPIAGTEALAYDFLCKGGKHIRPFVTLAVHDALTGGQATGPHGAEEIARWSDAVRRAAMSIEVFHKASLVHDDIEDDDVFRYGERTLHQQYGTATAINVGDYLIGMGYRLVSREAAQLGALATVDILNCLAHAHTRLSEGQGAELLWRDSRDKRLRPLDALKVYALKTAPAFEAALLTGVRLAQPWDAYVEPIRQFARNLGVAFQILNDLQDWHGDAHNKLSAGGDLLAGRPTVLWALALEGLSPAAQEELLSLADNVDRPVEWRLQRARHLYREANVFELAERLIEKHQQRAEAIVDELQPDELRRLLYYLIDTVLERTTEPALPIVALPAPLVLPSPTP